MKIFSFRILALLSLISLPAAARADHGHGGGGGGWHGGGGGWHGGGGHGYYGHGYYGHGYYGHGYYGRGYYGGGCYNRGWGWGGWGWPALYVGYSGPSYYDYYDGPSPYYYDGPVYRGVPRYSSSGSDDLFYDVQRVLKHGGYYHGGIDGVPGPGTQAAIRAYQSDHRLPVTGRVDGRLLIAMHLS